MAPDSVVEHVVPDRGWWHVCPLVDNRNLFGGQVVLGVNYGLHICKVLRRAACIRRGRLEFTRRAQNERLSLSKCRTDWIGARPFARARGNGAIPQSVESIRHGVGDNLLSNVVPDF